MSGKIKALAIILGTLIIVAVIWFFVFGYIMPTVGVDFMARIDTMFQGMGLNTDFAGQWSSAFSSQSTGTTSTIY